jgi:hypothetical protein
MRDEVTDHLLGGLKIGDNAVPQWPNGTNVPGCLAQHTLCVGPYGDNLFGSQFNRHYRRFVQHNAFVPNVNNGIAGS